MTRGARFVTETRAGARPEAVVWPAMTSINARRSAFLYVDDFRAESRRASSRSAKPVRSPFTPAPVIGRFREDPPNAAPRVGNITGVPGNHMDVSMIHSLPARLADIHAQIETRW